MLRLSVEPTVMSCCEHVVQRFLPRERAVFVAMSVLATQVTDTFVSVTLGGCVAKFCPLGLCGAVVVEGHDGSTTLCRRGDPVCTAKKTGLETVRGVMNEEGLWSLERAVVVVMRQPGESRIFDVVKF